MRSSICDRTDDTLDRSNTNKIWLSRKTHRDLYVCMANFAMEPVNYLQNISVGHHVLQSDEPSDNGGKDAAPDPHELLLASLGACTSITAQMYAARKKWPLEGMHVNLSWSTEAIEMEISFVGDLSEDQQQRLLEIANRCPIHRVLSSPVPIVGKRSDKVMNRS